MDRRTQISTKAADLFYNPVLRRWGGRILAVVAAAWVLMMVLGIELLTGTAERYSYYRFVDPVLDGYDCTYWTGTGTRIEERSTYGDPCPVWRWGRQVAG